MKNVSPMLFRRRKQWLRPLCLLACFALCGMASASEYHGLVKFAGLPLPGATVTASQGDKKLTAITDQQGFYSFPDLADGKWTIQIEMLCFATVKQDVTVAANAPMAESELKLLPLDQIHAQVIVATAAPAPPPPALVPAAKAAPKPAAGNAPAAPVPEPPADENAQRAADGLLVNGSVVNGATSPFAQAAAFGNNRNGGRSLYQYGLSFNMNNSAFDARNYSTSGVESPKLNFNDITGIASIGGPIRIPHVLRNGPNFYVQYTWTRNSTGNTSTVLVPDASERLGDFSHEVNAAGQPIVVYNPATGQPYTGDTGPHQLPGAGAAQSLSPAQHHRQPEVQLPDPHSQQHARGRTKLAPQQILRFQEPVLRHVQLAVRPLQQQQSLPLQRHPARLRTQRFGQLGAQFHAALPHGQPHLHLQPSVHDGHPLLAEPLERLGQRRHQRQPSGHH